ncbi:hypothetical protein ACAG26_18915 [Mycobacterium sp. pUA109]|uniref:hypothetical protein n=1 Tax=Mycobacterium sp. pUA109 TaxID=3238982 RepID=UPI00351B3F82
MKWPEQIAQALTAGMDGLPASAGTLAFDPTMFTDSLFGADGFATLLTGLDLPSALTGILDPADFLNALGIGGADALGGLGAELTGLLDPASLLADLFGGLLGF